MRIEPTSYPIDGDNALTFSYSHCRPQFHVGTIESSWPSLTKRKHERSAATSLWWRHTLKVSGQFRAFYDICDPKCPISMILSRPPLSRSGVHSTSKCYTLYCYYGPIFRAWWCALSILMIFPHVCRINTHAEKSLSVSFDFENIWKVSISSNTIDRQTKQSNNFSCQ